MQSLRRTGSAFHRSQSCPCVSFFLERLKRHDLEKSGEKEQELENLKNTGIIRKAKNGYFLSSKHI
jgi:hypothetical protein